MPRLRKTRTGGWFRIASAADYMDLSPRTVRRLLKQGLPHVKIPNTGTVLVRKEAIDNWLLQGQEGKSDEDALVREILENL